jgi:hypothetical protein
VVMILTPCFFVTAQGCSLPSLVLGRWAERNLTVVQPIDRLT